MKINNHMKSNNIHLKKINKSVYLILTLIFLSCINENYNNKIIGTYWLVATDATPGFIFLYFLNEKTVVTYKINGGDGSFDTVTRHSDFIVSTDWRLISKDSIKIKGLFLKIVDISDSVMLLEKDDKMIILYAVSDPHRYANKLLGYKIKVSD